VGEGKEREEDDKGKSCLPFQLLEKRGRKKEKGGEESERTLGEKKEGEGGRKEVLSEIFTVSC